jgi:hypothetical protein
MNRRERILLAFTEAYLDQLTPEARIAFLTGKLLEINEPSLAADLEQAAINIDRHAEGLNYALHHPLLQPHGVSP